MPDAGYKSSGTRTIDALTGLRFVAAFVVLVVHSLNAGFGYEVQFDLVSKTLHEAGLAIHPDWGDSASMAILACNAVTFFFVLSGFVLALVYHERLSRKTVFAFYLARWARIWPLHIACLTAVFFLQLSLKHAGGVRPFPVSQDVLSHLTLTQSWVLSDQWAFNYNSPAWSISTELGFYLLFPLLLFWSKRQYFAVLAGAVVLSGTAIGILEYLTTSGNSDPAFYRYLIYVNPLFRMVDFVVGIGTGLLFVRTVRDGQTDTVEKKRTGTFLVDTARELMAMVGLVFLFWNVSEFGWLHSFFARRELYLFDSWMKNGVAMLPGYAVVLWVFSHSKGMIATFLSRPLMIYLGEISFAIYLIQWPIILGIDHFNEGRNFHPLITMLGVIGLSTGIAALLHAVVEMPCRRFLVSLNAREPTRSEGTVPAVVFQLFGRGILAGASIVILSSFAMVAYEHFRVRSFSLPANGTVIEDRESAPDSFRASNE